MADIKAPYTLDTDDIAFIDLKKKDSAFNHLIWDVLEDKALLKFKKKIRDYYRKKQNSKCVYCKKYISGRAVINCHIEHIIPKSEYLDFLFEPKNLCVACAACNLNKGSQSICKPIISSLDKKTGQKKYLLPKKSELYTIYHPHFDTYKEHIIITTGIYVGVSDKGSNTVTVCKLNEEIFHKSGWSIKLNEAYIISLAESLSKTTDPIAQQAIISEIARAALIFENRRNQ